MTPYIPCTLYLAPETWDELAQMGVAVGEKRSELIRKILEEATETGRYDKTLQVD